MRVIRVASATLLATTVLALAAPAALADEGTGSGITSFGFSVSPSTVAPGGTVTLKSDSCEVPSVTVSSGVFDTVTLDEDGAGTATVDIGAKAGAEYEVTFDCQGEKGTAPLTIADASSGHLTGAAGAHLTDGAAADDLSLGGAAADELSLGGAAADELSLGGAAADDLSLGGYETGAQSLGTGDITAYAQDTGLHKGVKAGFGGGAGEFGTAVVAAGTALIVGALGGAGLLLLRRRRTDGGT